MEVVHLAVNGTLMRGLELNANLHQVHATFVREALTEPSYRLWSIDDRHPAMQRVREGGVEIAVEVWAVPVAGVSTLLQLEPPGLCIGKVQLLDGENVLGVLGEAILCEGQKEITAWGGWRAYMNDLKSSDLKSNSTYQDVA
ncbi:MAG: glutamyl-tRNA amidotransferase [Leptolyngbyaceae cyanobacterium bins.302]|nr:glutamyl-tRNA amidotransferase [Leptolyngbyaceae cyanobacterium bins.302]